MAITAEEFERLVRLAGVMIGFGMKQGMGEDPDFLADARLVTKWAVAMGLTNSDIEQHPEWLPQ